MITSRRLAFIGNSLPRRCGIATFTTDLQQAVAEADKSSDTAIVAMTDGHRHYDYPPAVRMQVHDEALEEYRQAADFLNAGRYDAVCLQHEFGIFGGDAGSHITALLSRLNMPIVTTFHTILAEPSEVQHRVLCEIADASTTVVVMAEKGRELLLSQYGVLAEKIEVIPHGIPDHAFVAPEAAKRRHGFEGRAVILTFGLLSQNKGIENMIDVMPSILKSRTDAVYVVLGATHPNLVRHEGERYRESLQARARTLGVQDHVVFLDRFVDQATLIDFISMCDIYVTPYLNESQMTSGTLAYSFGMGKAVVSTPYQHARELLADGRGVLVPFNDSKTISVEIERLLLDDARRDAMRAHAYAYSRSMTWQRTAERYISTFDKARSARRVKLFERQSDGMAPVVGLYPPPMRLNHFLSMCDDTGLFQHAIHSVPDRSHGYCIDDNARALLLACALNAGGEERLPEKLIAQLAAFIQHAWNPDARRFRNFMSFDRRWLENVGSEDSHGRTIWALGACAAQDSDPSRRRWATALLVEAASVVERFDSPRAWAFTLLGLEAYQTAFLEERGFVEIQHRLAKKLMSILSSVKTTDWHWFEESLAYDNARLPQALIVTGASTHTPAYTAAGLSALRWLMTQQTTEAGLFRPVGSQSFGAKRQRPRNFDQQPLEAAATISACLAAWRAEGGIKWKAEATRAFEWFFGKNDLSLPLIDEETGGCRDGLHPGRVNENRGGESVVSYLLGLAEIHGMARSDAIYVKPAERRTVRACIH